MSRFIIISFLFSICLCAYSQNKLDKLVQALQTADSVWIISHSETVGVVFLDDKGNKISHPLVENGKLNNNVIKERYLLNASDTKQLSNILARPRKDLKVEMAKCFIPFHAIIWKSKGKLFWIEIAFGCRRLEASEEISISEFDFDERKWNELLTFYKQKGLSYDL
jgi:hypothetical protein